MSQSLFCLAMSRSQIHTIHTVSSPRQPINRLFKSLLWISVSALFRCRWTQAHALHSPLAGRSCWIWADSWQSGVSLDGTYWFPKLGCGEVPQRAGKASICKHSWGSRNALSYSFPIPSEPTTSQTSLTSFTNDNFFPMPFFFFFLTNAWFWKLWIRGPWFQSLWSRNSTCLGIRRQGF